MKAGAVFRAVGVDGAVWVGYHRAATITRWTLEATSKTDATLTVDLADRDRWWLREPPTRIEVATGTAVWSWDHPGLDGPSRYRVGGPPTVRPKEA